jgi:phosphatidylglycerol---prolipoprotein diacylglyceryl transferase
MMALAFVTAGLVLAWQLRKKGIDPQMTYSFVIAAIIGGMLGAKLHYLIIHPDQFSQAVFSGRGLVWYGGLIGGATAVILVARRSKYRVAVLADAMAPALALAYAVGRMGCFLNGDDYGKPSGLPWAIAFPNGDPPTTTLVHPTQLYEILASLVIFVVLVWALAPRLKRAGALTWSYLCLAGVERFLVEFVRTNRPVLLGLTQQQWISVVLVAAGVAGLWWLYRPGAQVKVGVLARGQGAPVGRAGGAVAGSSRSRKRKGTHKS